MYWNEIAVPTSLTNPDYKLGSQVSTRSLRGLCSHMSPDGQLAILAA